MPQGEQFWNPYRWVPVSNAPVDRQTPAYHHRWQGHSGRIQATLEALTPFLINDGHNQGQFVHHGSPARPYVPGTSLKGLIRSLAELVGNAAVPFPGVTVDPAHALQAASEGQGSQ